MKNRPSIEKDPFKLVIAIFAGTIFGVVSSNISPFTIGLMVDQYELSQANAGLLTSVELTIIALAAILVAPLLGRVSLKLVLVVGVLSALSGQIATIVISGHDHFIWARSLAAIGFGLIYGAANAMGARSRNPDRVYSLSIAFSLGLIALFLVVLGGIVENHGYRGLVASVLILMLLLIPFLFMRQPGLTPLAQTSANTASSMRSKIVILLILAALFNLGTGAAWSFIERTASTKLQMNNEQIGSLLGISTFAGIFGAFLVSWLSNRVGRLVPLALGIVLSGVASFLLVAGINVPSFVVGGVLYWGSYMLVYTYLIALACELDSSGKAASATAGTIMLSFAMGPVMGSALLAVTGNMGFAFTCLAFCLISTLLLVPVIGSTKD